MDDQNTLTSTYNHEARDLDTAVGIRRERAAELVKEFRDFVGEDHASPSECIAVIEKMECEEREKLFLLFTIAAQILGGHNHG